MKKINDHLEAIITRKISGKITVEEEQTLNKWLASDSENQKYFQDLEKIYTQAANGYIENIQDIDVNHEWQRFKKSVMPKSRKTTYQTSWIRIAASAILIAVLGYLIWFNTFQSDNITVLAQYSGQLITLPDSTVVTLNKDASLTYPRTFTKTDRIVLMTGEAFFEVTRDESKPFIVNLGLSSVEVLGTSFNIDASENSNEIDIVVKSGKVRFAINSSRESVILVKGEKGILMKNSSLISKAQNNDINFMAWKTRKIVFNDVELDVVIQTVNKLYDSNISFSTDVGDNCTVTVSFDNQSIESILLVLELTLGLEYKKTGDVIEVVKTDCQ